MSHHYTMHTELALKWRHTCKKALNQLETWTDKWGYWFNTRQNNYLRLLKNKNKKMYPKFKLKKANIKYERNCLWRKHKFWWTQALTPSCSRRIDSTFTSTQLLWLTTQYFTDWLQQLMCFRLNLLLSDVLLCTSMTSTSVRPILADKTSLLKNRHLARKHASNIPASVVCNL